MLINLLAFVGYVTDTKAELTAYKSNNILS